jgi:hypothetical protein
MLIRKWGGTPSKRKSKGVTMAQQTDIKAINADVIVLHILN